MKAQSKPRADLKAIGARIRQLRGEMHQEHLAEYLGISQGQLSKIERGQMSPTAETLTRLAEKFRERMDWIVRGNRG